MEEEEFVCISPGSGEELFRRKFATESEIENILKVGYEKQKEWENIEIKERCRLLRKFVRNVVDKKDQLGQELTLQMGRPIKYSANELNGFAERANYMLEIGENELKDEIVEGKDGFERRIRKFPVGIVLIISAWNYPYLITVNALIPALIAGNSVILKHSTQTALVAESLVKIFEESGLPPGLFQFIHVTHKNCEKIILDDRIGFVNFTGSTKGGYQVKAVASNTIICKNLKTICCL
jgi:acyl-CoA reductase-like NAD-dependent aldehyde dehydrogenase